MYPRSGFAPCLPSCCREQRHHCTPLMQAVDAPAMLPAPKSQSFSSTASHPSFPHAFRASPGDADAPTIPVPWEMLPAISLLQPLLEASRALLTFSGLLQGARVHPGAQDTGTVPSTCDQGGLCPRDAPAGDAALGTRQPWLWCKARGSTCSRRAARGPSPQRRPRGKTKRKLIVTIAT